jgi:hypothetical protein
MSERYGYAYSRPEVFVAPGVVRSPKRWRFLEHALTVAEFIEHAMFTAVALLGGLFFLYITGAGPLATVWGIVVGMMSYMFWDTRR